jgi:hypothetical protein
MSEIFKHGPFGSWHIKIIAIIATSRNVASSIPDAVIGNFIATILRPQYHTGIDLGSNTNQYQEYVLRVNVADAYFPRTWTLSPADYPEKCEPQPPQNLRSCPGLYTDRFTCNLFSLLFNIFPLQLRIITFL